MTTENGRVLSEDDIASYEAQCKARNYVFALNLIATVRDLQRQVSELTEERDDYKSALEFYASEKTYKLGVQISMGSVHPLHEPIRYDKGEQARQTLAKHAPRQEDET